MAQRQVRKRLFSLQTTVPPPNPLAEPAASTAISRRSTISHVAGRLPKQLAQGQSLLRQNSPIIRPKALRQGNTSREDVLDAGELQWQLVVRLEACLPWCACEHGRIPVATHWGYYLRSSASKRRSFRKRGIQLKLSIKDTLNKEHLSIEDTVCNQNRIELCTNLLN